MKNKSILILLTTIALGLSACGTSSDSKESTSNAANETSTSATNTSSTDTSSAASSAKSSSNSSASAASSFSSNVSSSTNNESQVTVANYVLYGQFNGEDSWTEKSMRVNPSNSSEYMITDVTLYKDDIFKVHMNGNLFYGINDVKTSSTPNSVITGDDGYIKVKTSAIYSIYSSTTIASGGHVHIEKVGDIVDPSVVKVNSVSLDHTGQFITIGNHFDLHATISPSDATNKNITWSSDKTTIATVSTSGRVDGVSKGKCTITATTQDGNKVATCVVFVSDTAVPTYYLYGTISGQSVIFGEYTYPGIIDTTNYYIFYDVELYPGDRISVYDYTGHYLTDYYDHDTAYVFEYNGEHRTVNIRLYILSYNHNYLTIIE